MKRWNWRRTFWIGFSVALVVCAGAYFAMDFAVDYTLKQMARELEQPEVEELLESSSPVEETVEEEVVSEAEVQDATESEEEPSPSEAEAAVEPEEEVAEAPPSKQDPSNVTEATPVAEQTEKYDGNVSTKETAAAQENVSTGEKVAVASVLMKRFSAGELKQFMAIAKDGITVEEKKEARKIFLDRLSEEEYNELIQIAAKHGLSRGKTYDEVMEEEK